MCNSFVLKEKRNKGEVMPVGCPERCCLCAAQMETGTFVRLINGDVTDLYDVRPELVARRRVCMTASSQNQKLPGSLRLQKINCGSDLIFRQVM